MFRRFSLDFAVFSMALDMALTAIALAVASLTRPYFSSLPFVADIPSVQQIPLPLYPLFPFLWVFILQLVSVYDGRRNLRAINEIASLTLGSLLAIVTLAGTLYLSYRFISRVLFLFFALLTFFLLLSWRLIYRMAYRLKWLQGESPRTILIVGAGPLGRQFEKQVASFENLGFKIAGFLDDDPGKQRSHPEVIGTLKDARQATKLHKVDDVIIALPPRAYEKVNRLVAELHNLPVKVWIIPDYFQLALHKAVIDEYAGIPLLDLRAPALNEYQRMTKRIFDLAVVAILFIPTLIIMSLISLAIYLESGGPIFFSQQRVGENGHLFKMYKFRTMVPEAEQVRYLVERMDGEGHILHKFPDDPRVTHVGHFLRQTSMDELPQILNILKGEMSLVGPRPELPYLVDKYEAWQRKRFAVPQGLTGWWQVNGRSDKPMHLHTEDDLYYVQNYSLLLDLQILLKTIGVVIRRKGAY